MLKKNNPTLAGEEFLVSPHLCKSDYCPVCRSRNLLRRRKQLFNTLIGGRWRMVELTFKNHASDKTEQFIAAHGMLKKMIQRLRRKYGKFKYARVFEIHQSGFPHVHMIVNTFIPIEFIKTAWQECGGGHVSIHEQKCKVCGGKLPCEAHGQKKIISSKNAARYLTEELEKKRQDPHALGFDYFRAGVKTLMTSRNLKLKPMPYTDWMYLRAAASFQDAMYEYERLMYAHEYDGKLRPSINYGKNSILIGTGYADSPDVKFDICKDGF